MFRILSLLLMLFLAVPSTVLGCCPPEGEPAVQHSCCDDEKPQETSHDNCVDCDCTLSVVRLIVSEEKASTELLRLNLFPLQPFPFSALYKTRSENVPTPPPRSRAA